MYRFYRSILCFLVLTLLSSFPSLGSNKLLFIVNDNTEDQEAWKALAEGFERQHGVAVDVMPIKWGDYPTKLPAMLAGGVVPDVAYYSIRYIVAMAAAGAFEDLSGLRQRLPGMSDVFPTAFNETILEGKLYGIPTDINVSWLNYNVNLFDQAGLEHPASLAAKGRWNWDTYLEAAKRLTKDINGDGRIDQAGVQKPGSWPGEWPCWYWSNGADIVDQSRRMSLLDQPQAIEALQFLGDLINVHGVTTHGTAASRNNGQVGMWVDALNVVQINRSRYKFDWGIVPFPVGPSGKQAASTLFGGGYMIFKDAPNKELAYKFVQYLVSEGAERLRANSASRAPAKRTGLRVFLDEVRATPGPLPENLMATPELVALSRPLPVTPAWDDTDRIYWEEVNPVINGRQAARTALQAVVKRINPLLASW